MVSNSIRVPNIFVFNSMGGCCGPATMSTIFNKQLTVNRDRRIILFVQDRLYFLHFSVYDLRKLHA